MTDRASWWAKKLGQNPAPQQPQYQQPPPTYAPTRPWPGTQQPVQQQQPAGDPNKKLSKEEFEEVMASGDPDAMGGAKTRALQHRLQNGCPECGSSNYAPSRGTATDHCYDCGWTTRFGPRSA